MPGRFRPVLVAAMIYTLMLAVISRFGWEIGGEPRDHSMPRTVKCGQSAQAPAELPSLFRRKEFNAATLAEAVNYFVALGEEEAIKELYALAPTGLTTNRGQIYMDERMGWVCRILFSPTGTSPLRQPAFGGLSLPWESMPAENWPLYPVAQSGSSYFVLAEGYVLGGCAEYTQSYIDYCRSAGTFRREFVAIPTGDQALMDASQLRQSPRWQAIKWTDSGTGFHFQMDEGWAWEFIQKQADTVAR